MKRVPTFLGDGHAVWSRRRFLEVMGLAGAGALVACGQPADGSDGLPVGEMPPSPTPELPPWPDAPGDDDPTGSWWLDGMYRPVADERDETDLVVEGVLPAGLSGLYVRNGPNPPARDSKHWFGGEGMVHGVRFVDGRAESYRNRYIVNSFLLGADAGAGLPPMDHHPANISLIHHGDRLLALGETGWPFELDPETLSTIGATDLGGGLTGAMTAHPKVDPGTGRLHFFGYGFLPPYLTYYMAEPDGTVVTREVIDVPASTMMHDVALTESRVVFLDLPVVFDLQLAIANDDFPFRWRPEEHGARLGVMPHGGSNDDVVWVDIDPCYIFHTINAYDADDGRVVLEAVRHRDQFTGGVHELGSAPRVHRYVIDVETGAVDEGPVDAEQGCEFPMIDRRYWGRKHTRSWVMGGVRATGQGALDTIFEFGPDGIVQQFTFSEDEQPDEAFFVPAAPDAPEGQGWLVGFVHTRDGRYSSLYVIDTARLADGPVARVRMPRRVPAGIHGVWVPDA